jgi:hypothetical protein
MLTNLRRRFAANPVAPTAAWPPRWLFRPAVERLECRALLSTAMFDFDTGVPPLYVGQGTPFDQTAAGVTAHVSSPSDYGGWPAYSVQTDGSTGFHLSQFSGKYLYPDSVYKAALDFQFGRPLQTVTLKFATVDYDIEVPSTLELDAYQKTSSGTTLVGTASAHGTYGGDTFPMGTLSFTAVTWFNRVELWLPYNPQGATDFLVDSVGVTPGRAAGGMTHHNTPPATRRWVNPPSPGGTPVPVGPGLTVTEAGAPTAGIVCFRGNSGPVGGTAPRSLTLTFRPAIVNGSTDALFAPCLDEGLVGGKVNGPLPTRD